MEIADLAKFHIKKGNHYTKEEYSELLNNLQYEKAKSIALKYIGYSPRTIKETIDKLHSLELDPVVIDKTIEYLKGYGYLDDIEYARSFIRTKIRINRHGSKKITYDLIKKGIGCDISGPILEEYEEDEYESAKYLYNKRSKGKTISDYKEKAKMCRYLQSRGYSYSIIERLL